LTFCIWVYCYWYAGKLLSQVSSETPFKQYNDLLSSFEVEKVREQLTNASDQALSRRQPDKYKEEADSRALRGGGGGAGQP
jgi:hypothetical protein